MIDITRLWRAFQYARDFYSIRELQPSYSQEGEDLLLSRYLPGKSRGFYVDVGAHHPIRFSNTYHFYKKGWRGINIDATPGSMLPFRQRRPRDINIEVGISKESGQIPFFIFNDPALNTFDESLAQARNSHPYFLLNTKQVQVRPLADVLKEHVNPVTRIDFISIDVEGKDLEVLTSNDWNLYRPRFILIERMAFELLDSSKDEMVEYLSSKDYRLIAKTMNTLFFYTRI